MSTINVDTDKLKGVGEEIKSIAKDYNIIINELYSKINDISKNETWVSESSSGAANQFINAVNKDKEATQNLASSLNSLGEQVVTYAANLSNCSDNTL